MVPVRRPVAGVLVHDDDRIEEEADLLDDAHQALHVGVGGVALVGRGLHAIDRQARQDERSPPDRVPILRQDDTAITSDRCREDLQVGRIDRGGLRRGEPE
jgi:hypothetical protein